jgi:para-aminobenzoate synthetase/4-amino-4-deoxychorismate lyase
MFQKPKPPRQGPKFMTLASLERAKQEAAKPDRPATAASAPFVLLDDRLSQGAASRLFENPVEILRCDAPNEVEAALARLDEGLARGLSAAGFLSYELGYLFEPKLAHLLPAERDQPLLWMGLFEAPRRLDGPAVARFLEERTDTPHRIDNLRLSLTRDDYLKALAKVKDYIVAGDVYQINLTFKYLFDLAGDPVSLYRELRRKQKVAHGGLIHAEGFDVLSLSPELFIHAVDGQVLAKPMKGTAARRPTAEADAAERVWLHADEKSRAENLMIVDLLRNDLGRVAEIGSVAVPELFSVETYPTVHQMTSSVTARLRAGVGVPELLRSLFPCGSVTGAPKVHAMEIIRELEPRPRGVYTGAVGMLGPDGEVALNVAIRTLMLRREGARTDWRGEMGIGSGIVFDSDPGAEYEECLLKARFLTEPFQPFRLLETMRWRQSGGYDLLERHLNRLANSAAHFGYVCEVSAVRAALGEKAAEFPATDMRVRLTLGEDGDIEIEARPLPAENPNAVLRYALSDRPIDDTSAFFYHKTTRRGFYEAELSRLRATTGCDEVILCNARGELTEGTYTNLFIERNGVLLTPPVASGLLDGTLRRALLDNPDGKTREAVLGPEDLRRADAVYLGNSVRGLVKAVPADNR